jgi:hypothetical protein
VPPICTFRAYRDSNLGTALRAPRVALDSCREFDYHVVVILYKIDFFNPVWIPTLAEGFFGLSRDEPNGRVPSRRVRLR